jgi:hypothetical protein
VAREHASHATALSCWTAHSDGLGRRRLVKPTGGCVPTAQPLVRLSSSFQGHVQRAKRFDVLGVVRGEAVTIILTLLGALGILLLQFVAWKEIKGAWLGLPTALLPAWRAGRRRAACRCMHQQRGRGAGVACSGAGGGMP